MTTAAETREDECGGDTAEVLTVSILAVLDTVFQKRTSAAAMAGIRHVEGQKLGIGTNRK